MEHDTPGRGSTAGWRSALFPALLVLFALAYAWRISGQWPVPPLTDHLSNLYLTGAALVLLAGPRAFLAADRRRPALAWAAVLAVVNVVAEIVLAVGDVDAAVNDLLGGVNTSDPVDGVFGLGAVALVVVLLPRAGSPRVRP